jgi:transmembrane sensor
MPQQQSKLNAQILDEAANWFVEFSDDDADLAIRQAFDEWLRRSPEHVRAFLELLPFWERSAAAGPARAVDPQELIARASAVTANVVALNPVSKPSMSAPSAQENAPVNRSRHLRLGLAAAAALLIAVASAWIFTQRNTYSTSTGEQRSISLADGSILEMNARSSVRIRLNARERNVDLLDGQALFSVAQDKNRPFIVYSGDTRVRAIGTQFDVYRKASSTTVTVLEGRVATSAKNAKAVYLSAGQQVSVVDAPRAMLPQPAAANLVAATAWTQRRLMFQKTALADVVDEFNRYNSRPLRIDSPQIRAFLVSGTFSSTDPASLLRFLREQPGIQVIESDEAIRIAAAP